MSTQIPRPCCAAGSLHTGTPTGEEAIVHGLPSYVTSSPSGEQHKGIVVIISDIFGWDLPNSRILADEFAKQGNFKVYVPDFMNGGGIPHHLLTSIHVVMAPLALGNLLPKAWHLLTLMRYGIPFYLRNREKDVVPRISSWFRALRQNEGADLPVGAAGYCWGGPPVAKLSHGELAPNGRKLIDVGFFAHPAALTMPDDIEKVVVPLSVAGVTEDGAALVKQDEQIKEILQRKTKENQDREGSKAVTHEHLLYQGAMHGFAVRADEKDKEEAERGKRAEAQAVDWFKRWFAEWSG